VIVGVAMIASLLISDGLSEPSQKNCRELQQSLRPLVSALIE
jgi:hypothetical protein